MMMYRVKEELRPYKALDVPKLPEDVQNSIDRFLEYLNTTDSGLDEDIYRAELDSDINWYTTYAHEIDPEVSKRLKEYYVHGGIYNGQTT